MQSIKMSKIFDVSNMNASQLNDAIDTTNFPSSAHLLQPSAAAENGQNGGAENGGMAPASSSSSDNKSEGAGKAQNKILSLKMNGHSLASHQNENENDIPDTPKTPRTSTTPGFFNYFNDY